MTKEQAREYMRARRIESNAKGICSVCQENPKGASSGICESCALKRKAYMAERVRKASEAGLCATCTKRPVVADGRKCRECMDRHNHTASKRRTVLRAAGLCHTCTKPATLKGRGGRPRCADCYESEKERSKRNYAALKEAGRCTSCAKNAAVPGLTMCESCREKYLMRRFQEQGLTPERLSLMAKHCEVCERTEDLHIDHCHETNVIRGTLCQKCNHGLGLFNDDPDLMLKAVRYLNLRTPSKPSVTTAAQRVDALSA